MHNSNRVALVSVALLSGAALATRLLPHAPNLALMGTLAFVAGRYWSKGSVSLTLGLAIISDWFIGFYSWPVMLSVWLSYLLIGQLGQINRRHSLRPLSWSPTLKTVGLIATGSLSFYLITNTAVWAAGWYPLTLSGWAQSLINGLPFARNTFISDLSYTIISLTAIEGLMAVGRLQVNKQALATSRLK